MALNDESEPWSGEAAAAANKMAPVKQGSRQIKNRRSNEEEVITQAMKSAKKRASHKRDCTNEHRRGG